MNLKNELYKINKSVYYIPYLKICGYENLPNYKSKEWQSAFQTLFYENNLPQMWIIKSIIYPCPKKSPNVIVYLFLLSDTVKNVTKRKLSTYILNHFKDIVRIY